MPRKGTTRFTFDMTPEERRILEILRKRMRAATLVEALRRLIHQTIKENGL